MAQHQYDYKFNICPNDSLQILVRDRKSKRKFSNLFTKSKLQSMDLNHSVDELTSILQTAKDAKKNNLQNWKFLIKYKSNSSILQDCKLNARNTLFSYKKGDKMVILLHINEPQFILKTAFRLNEVIKNNKRISKLHTLPQSITKNPFSYPPKMSKSPRRSLEPIKTSKTLRKRVQSERSPRPQTLPNLSFLHDNNYENDSKISQLKRENEMLSNKIKEITKCNKQRTNSTNDRNKKENKVWLKQKIKRLQKSLNTKIIKQFGITFKQNHDWRETVNVSFKIIQKLVKALNGKDEQYESVSNKWISLKKENREFKKAENIKAAMIEKQKNIINDLKQQIADRDKKISLNKQNERSLEEKMKKMEKEFVAKLNEFDSEIEGVLKEKLQLNVQLSNSMHEMNETKSDCDEQEKLNNKLIKDIEKLKYFLVHTNQKSLQLIECINNSKEIISNLSYAHSGLDVDLSESINHLLLSSETSNVTNASFVGNNFV